MPERKSDKDLLADLLAKGYGAGEKRRRLRQAARAPRPVAEPGENRRVAAGPGPDLRRRTARDEPDEEAQPSAPRMEDSLPPLAPSLRRKIDRYARAAGFAATGLRERLRSALTVFAPGLADWVGGALLRRLVGVPGGDPTDPAACSLLDAMPMLGAAARLLLGGERGGPARAGGIRRPDESRSGERIAASLRTREPFLVPLLSRLAEADPMAVRALEFARIAYRRGERVRVRSLVRPVRYVHRIALATEGLEADLVARLVATAAEINRAAEVDATGRRRVEAAVISVRVLLGRMREFRHELFPVLLKCLAEFFPEESLREREHLERVCGFVELVRGDILDYREFTEGRRRAGQQRLRAAASAGETPAAAPPAAPVDAAPAAAAGGGAERAAASAPDAGEARAEQRFAARFAPVLQTLRELFPDSGIHRLEQYHFVLPYFDLRVFSKDLSFPPAAQLLARNDPFSQIMVLHRVIDNLITSIDTIALGEVLGADGSYQEGLGDLVRRWKEVYTNLFDPYLRQLEDYARLAEVDRHNPAARRMEDSLNRLRNTAVRRFGRVIAAAGRLEVAVVPLYSLAEKLAAECRQVVDLAGSRLVAERNRQAVQRLDALAARNVVDLEVSDYKPTIARVKRLLEKRFGGPAGGPANRPANRPADSTATRARTHAAYFEILSDVTGLYDWLLNDDSSFYRTPPDGPVHAGSEERRRWASAREAAMRGGEEPRPPAVSATARGWAADAAGRFEELRKAGRVTLILAEMVGGDVVGAEADAGAVALAAAAIPPQQAPAWVAAIGRERLLIVTPRPTRQAVGIVDQWRSQLAEALRRHPVIADVLEQTAVPGLGSLRAGVADCADCNGPVEAYARVETVLDAARKGPDPVAVWHRGAAVGLGDYLTRA